MATVISRLCRASSEALFSKNLAPANTWAYQGVQITGIWLGSVNWQKRALPPESLAYPPGNMDKHLRAERRGCGKPQSARPLEGLLYADAGNEEHRKGILNKFPKLGNIERSNPKDTVVSIALK